MYLKDIIPERMFEDTDFDYKATLQDENPMKWAKSIVAFANGDGGTIYVGLSLAGVKKIVGGLTESGLLAREGSKKAGRWVALK